MHLPHFCPLVTEIQLVSGIEEGWVSGPAVAWDSSHCRCKICDSYLHCSAPLTHHVKAHSWEDEYLADMRGLCRMLLCCASQMPCALCSLAIFNIMLRLGTCLGERRPLLGDDAPFVARRALSLRLSSTMLATLVRGLFVRISCPGSEIDVLLLSGGGHTLSGPAVPRFG